MHVISNAKNIVWRFWITVKLLKIRTHKKIAVIILKFEQKGFTVE